MKKKVFPFTAIVGQEKIKKALILNAINPSVGGVLIKGDRGTGKTTAVRALANLLPEIKVVEGCAFNCDENSYREFELYKTDDKTFDEDVLLVKKPMEVVELPLGATEDRIVGSLDIEKALHEGIKALEPGILAQANRNILYIDEINLLDDSLVDLLLDAAAFGVNIIEREGISISHPSNFILVGTMNPEEGELRGQLSDRIGLEIEVETILNVKDRISIMKRREEFEKDPESFIDKFRDSQSELQDRIIQAKNILDDVEIDPISLEIIARIALELEVEGHRNDINILKTSKTIAAFNNHLKVNDNDLKEAISLVTGEDRLLDQKIQNIKRDIEKREELDSKISQIPSQEEDINQDTNENEKNKTDIKNIDLENNESNEIDFVNDSDFKVKDDIDSNINQDERLENFNEIDLERKIDIKKY